jgi:hypothetical protein
MTTPNSFIDLLMLQEPEQRLNALLEKYLMHHPDSPAREVVAHIPLVRSAKK